MTPIRHLSLLLICLALATACTNDYGAFRFVPASGGAGGDGGAPP